MFPQLLLSLLLTLAPQSDRCAEVEFYPVQPVITAGQTQSFYAITYNCGLKTVRMEIEVEVETACGEEFELFDNYSRVKPGTAFIAANSAYPIAADACPGTYTATAVVKVGQTVLATESAEFEVVQP